MTQPSRIKRIVSLIQYNLWTVWKLLAQRGKHCREYNLTLFQRYFYTLKAIICILVGREPENIDNRWDDIGEMAILRGGYSFDGEYTTSWYEHIVVGHGFFSRWYAYEIGES